MPGIPAADLELLRRYDTPTICNVGRTVRPPSAHRRATWTAVSRRAIRRCRRPSATPARRRFARPRRRAPATSIPVWPNRWRRSPSCRGRRWWFFRTSTIRRGGDVRRGDVYHVQGVRRRRPDHERGRPRPRSGGGDRLPDLHQRHDLRPRLLPHSVRSISGASAAW